VYRVEHLKLGSQHALKVLAIPSEAVRERMVQEGKLQASLRHPNIVPVTDVVEVGRCPGLVMDFVDGPSLERLLANQRLELDQASALGEEILRGVIHAHENGFIHRDLKPANILLAIRRADFLPRISDFGLAKLLVPDPDASASISGLMCGTPPYMAPEQIRDSKHVDQRADVFALGAILYELVCGERAFRAPDRTALFIAIAAGRFAPVAEMRPNVPERMVLAIEGALRPKVDRRIQSAEALLATWLGSGVYTPSRIPAPPRADGMWPTEVLERSRQLASPAPSSDPTPSVTPTDLRPGSAPRTELAAPPTIPAPASDRAGVPLKWRIVALVLALLGGLAIVLRMVR
jgi:serine/threonine-protein kinase